MKVLIFAGYFYPHKGGYEDYIYKISAGLIKKGYEIDILTNNTEKVKSYEVKDRINIHRLDCWNALNNKYPILKPNVKNFRIIKNLFKKDYDFVNTHTRFWVTSLLGLAFAKMKKIPLVHVEHGTCHTEIDSRFISAVNRIVDHTFGSWIVKSAKLRVGVSGAALDFMEHLGKRGDLVISKGLDLKKFKKIKSNLRNKLKIKDNEIVISAVGRLIYAKGFQDLIQAVSSLNESSPRLILAGSGDYEKELKRLADKNKKVLFLGEKSEEEIIELLSASDIFVNPSYSEGLPTTVLEAGAVGIPVIATDVGGTKEIIVHKKTGLLINQKSPKEIKEAIEFMMKNKPQREKYAEELNALVKSDYNYENMIRKYQGIYE